MGHTIWTDASTNEKGERNDYGDTLMAYSIMQPPAAPVE
jgi:hypothetical protein